MIGINFVTVHDYSHDRSKGRFQQSQTQGNESSMADREEEEYEKSVQYRSFLRSLDHDSFISHVRQVQRSQESNQHIDSFDLISPKEISTPLKSSYNLASFLSSDPFNDGLDEALLNVGKDLSVEGKNSNQIGKTVTKNVADNDDPDISTDDDRVGDRHEFGDYATYFRNKHSKQQKADEEYVLWDKRRRGSEEALPTIFEGCVIHVNGHTNPSINEIHRLVISHGGKFISYLTNKSAATHIICDRLTPRKTIEFRNYKVVRAQWIVDSVSQKCLLNWRDYRLIQEIEYGQKRLDFAAKEDENVSEDELPLITQAEEDKDEFAHNNEDVHLTESLPRDLNTTGNIMDARHPEFLKYFFANSRLHHLSTWKADLRLNFLKRIVKEKKISPTESNKRMILHIDFDCFFATASCLKYSNLDIKTDPIAVTHGGRTSDVASCNYAARKYGVRNGMWMGKAKELCPSIKSLPYDFDSYEKYSNEFYNYLLSYEVFDSIFPVSIDEVLVDITTYALENANDTINAVSQLCQKIRNDIFQLTNCPVSVGASHNVLLAKLALKKAKPDNYFILYEGINEYLKSVRIDDLPGIGKSIKSKLLAHLDKSSNEEALIEDILNFEKVQLMKIFGNKTGEKLFEYARGIDHTSIAIDTSSPESMLGRKSISVDVNFGIRFEKVEEFEGFLMRMSKELYSRLIALGICGSSLTLKLAKRAPGAPKNPAKYLGMGICEFVNKSSRLGVATNDWGIIGSEAKALFRMMNLPVADLRGVSLTVTKLADVDAIKKSRQSKLQFPKIPTGFSAEVSEAETKKSAPTSRPKTPREASTSELPKKSPSLLQVPNDMEIDWEVFDSLPFDIRREIKRELGRRNMSSKASSPISRNQSVGGKAFLQQLIPTQLGSKPKYIRVVDSPTKSPKKSPRKKIKFSSVSPVKVKEEAYSDSESYSTTIINELPSSIRNEVYKDLEYKKKIRKFDLMPLREKLAAKYDEQRPSIDYVDTKWLEGQNRRNRTPLFCGHRNSFEEIKRNVDNWIKSSLEQKGPHRDDVTLFANYIDTLLEHGFLTRCLLIINHIKRALSFHESLASLDTSSDSLAFVMEGIHDWYACLNQIIIPRINAHEKGMENKLFYAGDSV